MGAPVPLYEVADRWLAVLDAAAQAAQPDLLADTLDAVEGELHAKLGNVGAFLLNLDATAAAMQDAEERMAARRRAVERRAEWLRGYLKQTMERCGAHEVTFPEFALRIRQNPEAVVADDESAVPDAFKRVKQVVELDRPAIRDAIRRGEPVPGAHLERRTRLEVV